MSGKAMQVEHDHLVGVLTETIHSWMECYWPQQLHLPNARHFSPVVCCEAWLVVQYPLWTHSV